VATTSCKCTHRSTSAVARSAASSLTKRSSDALNRFELMFVCDVVELGAQFWSCVANGANSELSFAVPRASNACAENGMHLSAHGSLRH
jgi:hypothetical protein